MRVFAISDIHVDYEENAAYVAGLSSQDYQEDLLILAGDVSHRESLLYPTMEVLTRKFKSVFFVPGNHDLWVNRKDQIDSLAKYTRIIGNLQNMGVITEPWQGLSLAIVPLFGWYDHSFGIPAEALLEAWQDYRKCLWPVAMMSEEGSFDVAVTKHFLGLNTPALSPDYHGKVISFSHFLPRIDIMPSFIPEKHRVVYPVLGTTQLDQQIRRCGASVHIYGHSHVNVRDKKEGVLYINNAMGYPSESRWLKRELACVYKD